MVAIFDLNAWKSLTAFQKQHGEEKKISQVYMKKPVVTLSPSHGWLLRILRSHSLIHGLCMAQFMFHTKYCKIGNNYKELNSYLNTKCFFFYHFLTCAVLFYLVKKQNHVCEKAVKNIEFYWWFRNISSTSLQLSFSCSQLGIYRSCFVALLWIFFCFNTI